MGFANRLRENIKKEISDYKYNRDLENDPAVVKNRLDVERQQIRMERQRLFEQKQLERDKQELRDLKNSTGLRGQLKSGLGSIRSYLDNVKSKNNNAEKFKLRNPSSNIVGSNNVNKFEIKGSGSSITGTKLKGMHENSGGKGLVVQEVGAKRKKGKGVFNQ